MKAYYNEIDPFAAQWLRNLMTAGLIAQGDVDERSIVDVQPRDLMGYARCHFFAGIGGWDYALKLADWPEDAEVWTGSCPCQPLSVAGQRKGHADERHLWPAFYRLIAERKPAAVFGEQVASKDGREWLAGVRADLESMGYACGAADLCAAGVGAPHRRQRIYWLGHSNGVGRNYGSNSQQHSHEERRFSVDGVVPTSDVSELADAECPERRSVDKTCRIQGEDRLPQREEGSGRPGIDSEVLGDANGSRLSFWEYDSGEESRARSANSWEISERTSNRRVKPGVRLLAHGIPGRVGKLRGFGNAIVPQIAAQFIGSYLDLRELA